jgi:hypothetical protein
MNDTIRNIQHWAHLLEIAAWVAIIGIPLIALGLLLLHFRIDGLREQLRDIQSTLTVLDEMDAED